MKRFLKFIFVAIYFLASFSVLAQQERWQQAAKYKFDILLDDQKHTFTGFQSVEYKNNSPEALDKVFYHLYFNAFQPGSMMDVRSQTIPDPDDRVGKRIAQLTPDKEGHLHIKTLTMNGKKLAFKEVGTILEVKLPTPIKPGAKVKFDLTFEGQVPLQIRRSGRSNKEGIAYSMSQWYPKMCEYDYEGWHANPYIGREFYGIWSDFEVNITLQKDFVVAGTGVVQNKAEVGHGYNPNGKSKPPKGDNITWKFKAENVPDFVWAADEDYLHDIVNMPGAPEMHFFYQNDSSIIDNWKELGREAPKVWKYLSENFGEYPYPVYSVIQGGDGGMEYPMATLITGKRPMRSLLGVTVHEGAHSWYQCVLGSNESKYAWMDEGLTSYASSECMADLYGKPGEPRHRRSYRGYYYIVSENIEQALNTHSDHFQYNDAYGVAAYSKGLVLVEQLKYVIGEENVKLGMKKYYDAWKFKHPNPTDFKRIMEMQSGLELDWYFEYFANTTETIDYGIKRIEEVEGKTEIELQRVGNMPMPMDVLVTYKDGSTEMHYIPMVILRGEKPLDSGTIVHEDWPWVNPTYTLFLSKAGSSIESVQIDPSLRMADINLENNIVSFSNGLLFMSPNAE